MGIANPLGAAALVAVAVLVALYLYDRRRRVVPVATMFLWRQLPPHALERRRFRPDLLFALQLAIVATLIAALLRPYVESGVPAGGGTPLALVLDVSASMQAREDSGATRFDLARRRARALVAERSSADEVMLIAAAERPHVVARWTTSASELQDRLEALVPFDTPTRLGPAIELALGEARARPGMRIAVLTDLAPEESGVAPEDLAAVDYVQLGATDDNLAIASLTVDQPPFAGAADASVTAVIRNYAHAPRRTVLSARVDGELWVRREVTLAARASVPILLSRPPRAGALVVTLEGGDALAVDDEASAWLSPGEPLDVLLVSDSRALAAAFGEVAAAVAGSKVEVVSPARYGDHPLAGRRTALFDGVVPDAIPPAVNALYVAPPPGNAVCPSLRALDHASVIDWEPEHPALRGLESLQALEAEHTVQLAVPAWGSAIVLAAARRTAFPFLVAGERDGRRVACLGAGLGAPLASSDGLPLLVLTLGTLRWLAEPYAQSAITLATGVPALAGRGPTAPLRGPHGGTGLRVAGDPPVLLAERAGVYHLGPADGERLVFANLFDDRESDIGRDGAGERPARRHDASAAPAPARRDLTWWCCLAAAVLLPLEWLVWLRRRGAAR
jgi:hypothetical protein